MATTIAATRLLLRGSPRLSNVCRSLNSSMRCYSFVKSNRTRINLSNFHQCSMNKNISLSRCMLVKFYSASSDSNKPPTSEQKVKFSIFQRFKQMYRDYWYVLVPVHLVTSAFWFGGFYYAAKSGIDIVGVLESLNVSETITSHLKDSSMGYIAVAYALYKLATPLRYTVTLGGTTLSIKYLTAHGLIKPVPSTQEMKDIYEKKRDDILASMKETREMVNERKSTIMQHYKGTKEDLKQKTEEFKTKKNDIMEDFEDKLRKVKQETKNIKLGQKPQPIFDDINKGSKKTKT